MNDINAKDFFEFSDSVSAEAIPILRRHIRLATASLEWSVDSIEYDVSSRKHVVPLEFGTI